MGDDVHQLSGATVLGHSPTGATFRWVRVTSFTDAYSHRSSVPDGPSLHSVGNWEHLLQDIVSWAGEVKYVTETPDFWAELAQSREMLATTGGDQDDTPFTDDERAEVSERMEQVKEQYRETPGLTDTQVRAIEQAIDELKESAASEKTTRKDWKLLLYGQAMNLFVAYAIPPHVVQGIINTAIIGLGHLLGMGGVPPVLPPQA